MPNPKQSPKIALNKNLALNLDLSRLYVVSVSDGSHTFGLKFPRPVYAARAALKHHHPISALHAMALIQATPYATHQTFLRRTLLNAASLVVALLFFGTLLTAINLLTGPTHRPTPKQETTTKSVKA